MERSVFTNFDELRDESDESFILVELKVYLVTPSSASATIAMIVLLSRNHPI
jgi:hypothetical protein